MTDSVIRIAELFAGVGGFRVGFEAADSDMFKTVWSNQFEPSTKRQHASEVYQSRFGSDGHANMDINLVPTCDIPDHDLLCGGFPCQDYSVANNSSNGIEGKKGVLWWQIIRILKDKADKAPSILFLENVDRLINCPQNQRGRDFAIILQSLSDLDYVVEWRVINAADYGMPQKRRRTFILAYKKDSIIGKQLTEPTKWMFDDGIFAKAFPVKPYCMLLPVDGHRIKKNITDTLADVSEYFNKNSDERIFENTGVMVNGIYYTYKTEPKYNGCYVTLADILADENERELITEDYYISDKDLPKWQYLKGAKNEIKTTKAGYQFNFTSGAVPFPDNINGPARTIITGEGGAAPSRFKHVIKDPVNGRLRRLIPVELERINMFPTGHTAGVSDTKRAFFMGNALVCGIITKTALELKNKINGN